MVKYLNIELNNSVFLMLLLIAIYGLSMLSLCLLSYDWPLKLVLCFGLLCIILVHIRAFLPNYKKRVRFLQVSYRGKMALLLMDGTWVRVEPYHECFCSPWIIIVRLKTYEGESYPPLVVACDQMPAEMFRQLSIALKWF